METMKAFLMGEFARAANAPMKAFDWLKAAHLINDYGIKNASAGLAEDLEWTEDNILRDGKPVMDSSPYLASCWATPILRTDAGEFDCYTYNENSNPQQVWPQEALEILNSTGE